MRLPGKTRPGSCAMPIEPGLLCESELPCEARFDEKWWRLITPAKPLPIVVPCTSTFWPTLKMSTLSSPPTLSSPTLVGGDAELAQLGAGFDAGLGEVAGQRLGHAGRAALAERDLHGHVAVVFLRS